VTVPGFDDPYLSIQDVAGLIAMVQMGVLELHPWGVTVEEPARPDRIIFDLDPDEGLGFEAVVRAAIEVRERLRATGLESFVKTTGGKGLHVVVPIDPRGDCSSTICATTQPPPRWRLIRPGPGQVHRSQCPLNGRRWASGSTPRLSV
jgi:DNA ligase D-like protein (predicted polymerase)